MSKEIPSPVTSQCC